LAPKKQKLYSFPDPIDNDYLVGHSEIMRAFDQAWANRDRYPMHPVWMLSGAKGIGKATLAHNIARKVYGNIGDFFIIDMAHNIDKDGKPKTDGKVISVYTIRAMIEKMQLSAMSGGWRVVLIDSVDELNVAASNAMLKLLEEPPANTLFLLVAHHLGNVLPTIRSRARIEKLSPLSISQLRELCAKFIPDEDVSTATLKLSSGSFGKIAALKSGGGDAIYEELIQVLENPKSNSSDLMAVARKIAPDKELHGIVLDAIAHFGAADLYPKAARALNDISAVYLEPEIGIFKILGEIKRVCRV
jgi:DNA polymerase-3 subunit delta'